MSPPALRPACHGSLPPPLPLGSPPLHYHAHQGDRNAVPHCSSAAPAAAAGRGAGGERRRGASRAKLSASLRDSGRRQGCALPCSRRFACCCCCCCCHLVPPGWFRADSDFLGKKRCRQRNIWHNLREKVRDSCSGGALGVPESYTGSHPQTAGQGTPT